MIKYFIITVDTEGENGWSWQPGKEMTTENASFIPRFQNLCDNYGFKPVYLTNYEMAINDEYIQNATKWESEDRCEIGIHPHSWNNPPIVNLKGPFKGQEYLFEHSAEVMRSKFSTLFNLLTNRIGHNPISHRAGRWAMDDRYFEILSEFGIKVDCSYTPGIDWQKCKGITKGGSNYLNVTTSPHFINGILEVPVTIRTFRAIGKGSLRHKLRTLILPHKVWCRPSMHSLSEMKKLVNLIKNDESSNYIEFMIHSSELMPGGSPYFVTDCQIESLYISLKHLFEYVNKSGFSGITLKEYCNTFSCYEDTRFRT